MEKTSSSEKENNERTEVTFNINIEEPINIETQTDDIAGP